MAKKAIRETFLPRTIPVIRYSSYFMQASRLAGMLEHCGITFSWGTEFGKGGPILAAKIGPGGPFLVADRFFRYRPSTVMHSQIDIHRHSVANI